MTDKKTLRMETIRMLISSNEISGQDVLLKRLNNEGIYVTQATLSRDLRELKVAKAVTPNGKYVYVLPHETMYRRVSNQKAVSEMLNTPGFKSITFSGDIGVIRTKPGYASSIAYNIDSSEISDILGTIAGDDTIIIVTSQGCDKEALENSLKEIIQM